MNKEAMLAVADLIEVKDRFDMWHWMAREGQLCSTIAPVDLYETCDTTGCVAGWAIAWAERNGTAVLAPNESFSDKAAEILGLTADQALLLFYAEQGLWPQEFPSDQQEPEYTAKQAAYLLRRIVDGHVTL